MYKFRERIKDLRDELDYSQEDIAKKMNLTASAYGYYEQGRNEPSLETLKKIADIYQVSSDYLLGRIDQPTHPIQFTITDELSLSEAELLTIKKMKEVELLNELSEEPNENVEKLNRYWEFIKNEPKI